MLAGRFLDASATHPQGATVGRSRRDFHPHRRIQCRHGDRIAERELRERYRDRQHQVIAVTGEDFVVTNLNRNEQISGWLALRASLTLACQADFLPIDDTGRDPHGNRTGPIHGSASRAGLTGVGDLGTSAVAVRTRLGKSKGSPVFAGVAGSVALPAGGLFSGFRSGAVAGSARCVAAQL